MADGTQIEWTEATWNPITGCSVTSPGCTNCYAMKLAGTRLAHIPSRAGLTQDSKAGTVWTGEVRFNEQWVDQPLRWTKPRMIFVCAHGDLFHEKVPDEWIDRIFAVMALCPQHTFQVLTKRSARMREYLSSTGKEGAANRICYTAEAMSGDRLPVHRWPRAWPYSNIWLGVSVEDQQRADERIPDLLATPASIRWISAEPLLGPVDLTRVKRFPSGVAEKEFINAAAGRVWTDQSGLPNPDPTWAYPGRLLDDGARGIDWVVAGGESGPGARPMHPGWARSLRDQCAAADVPFFFKQWGEFAPAKLGLPCTAVTPDGAQANGWDHDWQKGDSNMVRLGKKRAGRLLDGVEHSGMPGGAA